MTGSHTEFYSIVILTLGKCERVFLQYLTLIAWLDLQRYETLLSRERFRLRVPLTHLAVAATDWNVVDLDDCWHSIGPDLLCYKTDLRLQLSPPLNPEPVHISHNI